MSRLRQLVELLINGSPHHHRFHDPDEEYFGREGVVGVWWYSRSITHCVHLAACEHQILLTASYDDGGPCPPQIEVGYSPVRLKMLLDWMAEEGPLSKLSEMQFDAYFNQKFDSDPPITKHMFGGRITDDIWHDLKRLAGNEIA